MPAQSLELQYTKRLIRELNTEIVEIEKQIQSIMDELQSPVATIPGIGSRMATMILAEAGDFACFEFPDKLRAYAGCPLYPSIRQTQELLSTHEKAGLQILALCPLRRN